MMLDPMYFTLSFFYYFYFVLLFCNFTLALDHPLFCSVPCTLLQQTIQATIPPPHLDPAHPPLPPHSPPHPLLPHHPPPLPRATLPHLLHFLLLPLHFHHLQRAICLRQSLWYLHLHLLCLDSLHNPQDFPRPPSPIGMVLCIFPRHQAQAAHLHSPPNPPIRPNPPTSQNPPPPPV